MRHQDLVQHCFLSQVMNIARLSNPVRHPHRQEPHLSIRQAVHGWAVTFPGSWCLATAAQRDTSEAKVKTTWHLEGPSQEPLHFG